MTLELRVAELEKEISDMKEAAKHKTAELSLAMSKSTEEATAAAIKQIHQDFLCRGPLRRSIGL